MSRFGRELLILCCDLEEGKNGRGNAGDLFNLKQYKAAQAGPWEAAES